MLDDPVVPAVPDPANQISFELWKLDVKEFYIKPQELLSWPVQSHVGPMQSIIM